MSAVYKDDVIVSAGNGAAQPEVMVRSYFDAQGKHLRAEVYVGGWMLSTGQYVTREGAMRRAEAEVELARTQRRGHHW